VPAHLPDAAHSPSRYSAAMLHAKAQRKRNRILLAPLLAVAGLCLTNARATAQVTGASPGWTFDAAVYGWLTAMSGDLSVRGFETSFDESFIDTVSNSDSLISFMVTPRLTTEI
jgi:hypothetical protein